MDRGDMPAAAHAFAGALALGPDEPWFHHAMAAVALARDGFREAERHCRRAIALDPAQGWFHELLGRVAAAAHQPGEAIDAFSEALARDPGEAWFWYRRGKARQDAGLAAQAVADLERAAALAPAEPAFAMDLGNLLYDLNRATEAVSAYGRALAAAPGDPWCHAKLADALFRAGRPEEAPARMEEAEALDPAEPWFPYRLAELYLATERPDAALEAARRALALEPEADWPCVRVGEVLARQGRYGEAGPFYREAIRRRLRALGRPAEAGALAPCAGPDFFVAGFPKCGTTALYEYLVAQAGVLPAAYKEPMYFSRHFQRGTAWYESLFARPADSRPAVCGEASSGYAVHPRAAARIRDAFPAARLVFLLRDPVERAVSDYRMWVRDGAETRAFDDAVQDELAALRAGRDPASDGSVPAYVAGGIYVTHLQRFAALFPRERMLLLRSEDLFARPAETVRRVLDFLGVPPGPVRGPFRPHNVGPPGAAGTDGRGRLAAFYRDYNRALLDEFGIWPGPGG